MGGCQRELVSPLRGDGAGRDIVAAGGDLSPEARRVPAGSGSRQGLGHGRDGGEGGGCVLSPDTAVVVADAHVDDPVRAVCDGPTAAPDRPGKGCRRDRRGGMDPRLPRGLPGDEAARGLLGIPGGEDIADVNHGNLVVAQDGTVRLIDCDSLQVTRGGQTWYCPVGVGTHQLPRLHQGRATGAGPMGIGATGAW